MFIILISCKQRGFPVELEEVVFEIPQPINDAELYKIPSKFLGRFMNIDSTYLTITKEYISNEYRIKNKVSITLLDSLKTDFTFEHEKLISKKNRALTYDYRILKDSIELTTKQFDVIFKFSKNKKAKQFNGQLILNEKDSIFWKIQMISVYNNYLEIKQLSYKHDLSRIDSITKIKSKNIDSIYYILQPSRREFKKIINLQNIGYRSLYKKVY